MQKWSKIVLFASLIVMVSCQEDKNFPPTPYLEYTSHQLISKTVDPVKYPFDHAEVTLFFTDGDGDLGHDENFAGIPCCDSCDNSCNLFVDVWSKIDGVWDEKYEQNLRIESLTPTSQDPTLEGDIILIVNLDSRFSDTVRLDFQIYDRSFNSSALVSTPEIYVDL